MTFIQKTGNNKCWWECGEKRTLVYCWWECKLGQPVWRTTWKFLRKLKIELPYDPAILLLDIYPRERKSLYQDICTPVFVVALFIIAKIWKQPKCSSADKWKKKMYLYTIEYYSAIKKNEILSLQQVMSLEEIRLNEMSETERQIPHVRTHILKLKKLSLVQW